jgi:hypothetical protein
LFAYRIHSNNLSRVAQTPAVYPIHRDAYAALRDGCEAIGGRCLEPRIRALVSLQQAFFARLTGETADAREAVESACEIDVSVRDDPSWLLWWLSPRQGVAVPPESVAVEEGFEVSTFGRWFISCASGLLSIRTSQSLTWAVEALEMESRGDWRPRPKFLAQCLTNLVSHPHLLGNRWFAKAVLASTGTLPAARKVRSWRS